MSASTDLGDEKRKTEFSSFVMREVQRILAQCDEAKNGDKAAVAPSGSPSNELTAVAAEFLGRLEAEAARRLNAQSALRRALAADAPCALSGTFTRRG